MKKISTSFIWYYRVQDWVLATILIFIALQIAIKANESWSYALFSLFFIILAIFIFKHSLRYVDVYLIKNGIHIKGISKSESVEINNICDIQDSGLLYTRFVTMKFNRNTTFGKSTVFVPKRRSLLSSDSTGLNALKRAIGK
jgi:hypothetical protein